MSGEQQLSGPDLTEGVGLAKLASGCLLGHAAGEAVLLARAGGEIFAVAANCTHYGGPLAQGLLVDDTVRCPWHHACFSLRTGEALRAPALNPVARYRVERQGERVFVREKLPPLPAMTAAPTSEASHRSAGSARSNGSGSSQGSAGSDGSDRSSDRSDSPHGSAGPGGAAGVPSAVVIIGAGAAGNAAALRLRRKGYGGPVTLVGGDDSPPYDRPNLSKDYLAGNAPEEWIPLLPREHYDEIKVELRLGRRATAIDPRRRTVTLDDGASLPYGALLLATGAEPVRLQLPGGDLPHVHYLRTLADSRAIVAEVETLKASAGTPSAVVMGASFIGLEVAAALRARGLEVTVVAPDAVPLERILGREVGAFVRDLHEEHGVAFRLGARAAAVDAAAVTLETGERLDAGLVVVGVGVRPALTLAESAGLAVDNGVLVDEYLQTSSPGIYAAGDIARWPDAWSHELARVEHWVVAERQGQTAAANILGRRERFDAAPFFWSQHYDVQISFVGRPPKNPAVKVAGSLAGRDATVTYSAGDRVMAVATVCRDGQSLAVELAMERQDEAAIAAALNS